VSQPGRTARLRELLVDRALGQLTDGERLELQRDHPQAHSRAMDPYELAAAALHQVFASQTHELLPGQLADRILASAPPTQGRPHGPSATRSTP